MEYTWIWWIFYNLLENKKKVGVQLFLIVSEAAELYRKLREACRKTVPQVSSQTALVTPSYLQMCFFFICLTLFLFFQYVALWLKEFSPSHCRFEICTYKIFPRTRTGSKGLESEIQVPPKGILAKAFRELSEGILSFKSLRLTLFERTLPGPRKTYKNLYNTYTNLYNTYKNIYKTYIQPI